MPKRGRLSPGRGDQSEAVSDDESKDDSLELYESLSLSKINDQKLLSNSFKNKVSKAKRNMNHLRCHWVRQK